MARGDDAITPRYITAMADPAGGRRRARRRRRRRVAAVGMTLGVAVGLSAAFWALAGRAAAPGNRMSSPRVTLSAAAPQAAALTPGTTPLAAARPRPLADTAVQAAAIDRALVRTQFVRVAGGQHREIALTFDDGPGPYTPRILDVLERAHVPATFFAVGVLERWFHAATTRELRDGDVVGDHTFTHAPMGELAAATQRTQLLEAATTLERNGAGFPRLFRPPYGMFNPGTMSLLRRYRMLMVLWTVDTNDYRRPGAGAILHAAVAGARPGAIILLHDAGGDRSETVAAVPRIIAALRRRGYRLVTVPQLLADNPPPPHQTLAAMPAGGG